MRRTKQFLKSNPGLINVFLMIVFLLALYAVGRHATLPEESMWGNASLFILLIIPSAIWTIFFYLQDRIEPEPIAYVVVCFIAGMASANLVAIPLENQFFRLYDWMYESTTYLYVGSIFVLGGIASFLIYLIIRYGFYASREFDEPVDGMVYGAFAGAGFVVIKSHAYLAGHPDFTLFSIGYTASTNIMVYASVASLIGGLIGKNKFLRKDPQLSSIIAIFVGMILIGSYHILNEFIFLSGFANAVWISVILTVVFAVIILSVVYLKMKKLVEKDLHEDVEVKLKPDYLAFILFIIILTASGFAANLSNRANEYKNDKYAITFQYSPSLSLIPIISSSQISTDLPTSAKTIFVGGSQEKSGFSITIKIKDEIVDLSHLNESEFTGNITPLSFLTEKYTIESRKAVRVKYSYMRELEFSDSEFPEIVWEYTDLIPTDKYTMILTLTATPVDFRKAKTFYLSIIESLRFH